MKLYCLLALLGAVSVSADAAPGVGEKVYGATINAGVSEVEARYGRLTGGPADGEDGLVFEFSHGFGNKFYGGALFEFEHEPGGKRELEALGLEGIVQVAHSDKLGLDAALYGEYEVVREGRDKIETKLLLEHRKGSFDGRVNLITERELEGGAPLEFAYAASADWHAFGEFRFGVEAFGDLGNHRHFLPRAEHYAGPMVKTEIEHLPGRGELEIETGYLFALAGAKDEADGQARLLLEYEFHF